MEPLKIVCPTCSAKAELSIDADAEMVLLNCFKCKAPILYFHGETTTVDGVEMNKLQEDSMKAIEGFLSIQKKSTDKDNFLEKKESHKHQKGEPLLDHIISDEDILDLKIDLHYSNDVLDFIKKL